MFTYLLINLGVILIPLLASFEHRVRFVKYWKPAIIASLVVAIPKLTWDGIFVATNVWGFNPEYLIGVNIVNIPLEEVLFFFTIPFACLFIYRVLGYFFLHLPSPAWLRYLPLATSVTSGLIVLLYFDRSYTLVVCGIGSLVSLIVFLKPPSWLNRFLVMFAISILPFLVVNRILTSGLGFISDKPIVWYDDSENLGIRIGTIPIEDLLYSFVLLIANTAVFEYLLRLRKIA